MLVLDDNHAHHMRTACEEVKARGAELIIITDNKKLADGLDDNPIVSLYYLMKIFLHLASPKTQLCRIE